MSLKIKMSVRSKIYCNYVLHLCITCVNMEQTFYVGMKICDYYAVHINDDGYEQKEMVQENEIDGFVHCLKVLGYKEI